MMNWNQIDTVLLDMDGTLLDLHFDSHFWLEHLPLRFAEKNKLELHQVQQQMIDKIMAQEGKLNWYSLDFWSQEFQLDVPALKYEIKHLINFRADALNFLQQLQKTNIHVILATNADHKSLELKLPLTKLDEYVDTIYSSCSCGFPKEEQGYWQALQMQHDFNPDTSLLIDDNENVLFSAQQFGISQLVTIKQPNSKKPARSSTNFPGINLFSELNLALS